MVATSREEAFSIVVNEAMASGLPIVASDIGPHRERIAGKGWGELFQDGNAEDLAKSLEAMLDADLEPYRKNALAFRDDYSLEKMISGYERACQLAIEGYRR